MAPNTHHQQAPRPLEYGPGSNHWWLLGGGETGVLMTEVLMTDLLTMRSPGRRENLWRGNAGVQVLAANDWFRAVVR
jgi:hypothetical protein